MGKSKAPPKEQTSPNIESKTHFASDNSNDGRATRGYAIMQTHQWMDTLLRRCVRYGDIVMEL